MYLAKFFLENVRSLDRVEVVLCPGFNIITGSNGSGKTSFLEALHILSMGRSFRSRSLSHVLTHGKDVLRVFGQTGSLHSVCVENRLGVQYAHEAMQYRLNRATQKTAAELSKVLPVVVFSPETPDALSKSGAARRAFLDWGCFQNNPEFLEYWRKYQRALKQRNAILRSRKVISEIGYWDEELAFWGKKISRARKDYLDAICSSLEELTVSLGLGPTLSVQFSQGWSESIDLVQVLRRTVEGDYRRGFTYFGSHRDDLKLHIGGRPLNATASRGQIKLVAFSLKLVQVKQLISGRVKSVVFLLDEIESEFDREIINNVFRLLASLDCQVIMTALEPAKESWLDTIPSSVFHVKHGTMMLSSTE